MLTEIVVSLNLFLLVFARLGAMIFPSPVFGRKNVPMRIRAGLVLALTLLLVPVLNVGAVSALSGFDMVEGLVREILLGLIVGFVFQIFFFMIFVAGDMLDTVFGLAMGKVMDPGGGCTGFGAGAVPECVLFPVLLCHGKPPADDQAVCLFL